MDVKIKQSFLDIWNRFFPGAELPLACFYTDDRQLLGDAKKPSKLYCAIGQLGAVRRGADVAFETDDVHCSGAQRYFGYTRELRENFEYFLSCGIPGEMEGERYKKNPQVVRELLENDTPFEAPAKYLVFKRWDSLSEQDNPEVVIFLAEPDVLSGLFTLSGYEESTANAAIAPFCAGCGAIVKYPYLELRSGKCRSVIGMFDVSARPYVPAGTLSFSIPWPRFEQMVENASGSFLATTSWAKVRNRLSRGN